MYKCKKCDFETDTPSKIANHYQHIHKEKNMCYCDNCGKEFKSERGLKCHTKKSCDKLIKKSNVNHICPKCNFFIKNNIQKHIDYCDGLGPRNKKPKVKRKSLKGISYEERFGIEKSNEIKKKISEKITGFASTSEKEIERRKKLSEHAKKNNYGGYIKGSGRGKSGWYKNYWCDSSWELAFVVYNLEHNVEFKRNEERFEYYWKDKKHIWIPDFIVNDVYYEIKGYWTDQCQSKFDSFKKPLKILYQKEMKDILNYVTIKYGKDYIKLYENNKEKSCSLCGGYIWKYNKLGVCVNCIKKNNSYAFNNDKKFKNENLII